MSGHSKWSQIKRQKGATDARRSQLFTKLGREIAVAARHGGADPNENAGLRLAVQKARQNNMPKDNIERAIERAAGQAGGADWQEVRYEAYGPGGVALLIDALTDNRNRTVADVRSAVSKAGGNMGEAGSVGWIFAQKGVITVDLEEGVDGDAVALVAIDAGAEDVVMERSYVEIVTAPGQLEAVREALEQAKVPLASAEVTMRPTTTVPVDEDRARSLLRLIETLEELDDVQSVATNAEIPESVLVEA